TSNRTAAPVWLNAATSAAVSSPQTIAPLPPMTTRSSSPARNAAADVARRSVVVGGSSAASVRGGTRKLSASNASAIAPTATIPATAAQPGIGVPPASFSASQYASV